VVIEKLPAIEIKSLDKKIIFDQARQMLTERGFRIIDEDMARPWGFFLSVDESQAPEFIKCFYDDVDLGGIDTSMPLRPKILGIQQHQRLSLQVHDRRSEIWRDLAGEFHVIFGPDEDHLDQRLMMPGDVQALGQGTVHRAAGLDRPALVAEIWQHTDPTHLSDENDIKRLQDDHGRQW